jgi:hypothetical protein
MSRRTTSILAGAGCLLIILIIAVPLRLGYLGSRGMLALPGFLTSGPEQPVPTNAPDVILQPASREVPSLQATTGFFLSTPTLSPTLQADQTDMPAVGLGGYALAVGQVIHPG